MLKDSKVVTNIRKHIHLERADIEYLETIFSFKIIKKKETLFNQGHLCKELYFVEKGSIRAFNLTEQGKRSTMMFAIDDWWITDIYCFLNQKSAYLTLEALEDTKVAVLNYTSFELLLNELPKFNRFFRILFQNAYAREQMRVLESISLSTEDRFTRFLHNYPQIVEKLTQKEIASYLGVTPEFLSSVKKK
ncbi:Crp/Fnr family transcriptional regulator [Maribacter sp. CXY002]|uniref:Crp/Fnr family transcriptional regulator n=1 Tax=Maribacter luteocoastalis TaxID=3407671 RepID=UPI003B66D899